MARRNLPLLSTVLAFSLPAAAAPLPKAQLTTEGGVVRIATNIDVAPMQGTPAEIARTFALAHLEELGGHGLTLSAPDLTETVLGTVARFEARVNNLPVPGTELTVAVGRDGRVLRVVSGLTPVSSVELDGAITAQQAIDRAAQGIDGVKMNGVHSVGATRQIAFIENGVARLGWQVALSHLDPLMKLVAVVDARTGELRSRVNRTVRADTAKVWVPNPGKDATTPLTQVTLQNLPMTRDPDGHLAGNFVDSATCCAHEGCDPSKPPKQVTGTYGFGSQATPYTSDFCDMLPRATNVNDGRTDYDYSNTSPTQFDPPTGTVGSSPGDEDVFSEVSGYYHVNAAYDLFRTLSPNFLLRDQKKDATKRLKVWTNFLTPNYNNTQFSSTGIVVKGLTRVDNSAYVPSDSWEQFASGGDPKQFPDTDAVMLFQGGKADFAYDGDVAYHELTHGVIFSTANFQGVTFSEHGALAEGGAMHEGIADYFAAAFTQDSKIGDYVGPRLDGASSGVEGALRDLDGAWKCPDVLIGEAHNDSQHFSASMWAARKKFLGNDQGRTFDKAVLAALASAVPTTGFDQMASLIADSVATTVGDPKAKDTVLAEFKTRGASGCSQILDYTGPRADFGIAGTAEAGSNFVPGPIQFRLKLPKGSSAVSVAYSSFGGGGFGGGGGSTSTATMLINVNKPVTFKGAGFNLSHDAKYTADLTSSRGQGSGSVNVPAVCGDEIYVAFINKGQNAKTWQALTISATNAKSCPAPAPDAGMDAPDAAEEIAPDAGAPSPDSLETSGCGCSSTGAAPLFGGLFALLGMGLRRRRNG